MTLNRLIKELQKLQRRGHGRAKVTVDRHSLWDGNGTVDISDINSVSANMVIQADGDGGTLFNRDGSERQKHCIILSGEKPETTQ